MNNIKYNYKKLGLVVSVILIGFSSCKTSKNVAELNTDTDGLYRFGDENPTDTTSVAYITFNEYFKDEKLVGLITEALSNNLDAKMALERIKQAETSVSMAKAAKLPTLSIFGEDEYLGSSTSDKVLSEGSNTLLLGFNATWEVDIWGKLNSQKKAQLANYLNSYEALALLRTNIIAGIASGYYNLIALDEQLKVTKETIKLLQESSETMQALKDAGQQNGAAVEQSNALLYSTQLSVYDIESAIRQQENTICILMGKKPGPIDRNTLDNESIPDELEYGVPAQLLANRPDVKSAELSFRQAFELTNVAQRSLYPSFTLSTGFLGFYGTGFGDLFKPERIATDIIGDLAMPLFYQKKLKGNLEIAKSQQREAALNFESTVLSAGQEISDILFGFDSSVKKNEWRQKQIASLTNAVDFTQELLKAGEANYVEVLSAQQSLLSAQLSGVNDKLEQLNYSVNLYKALGGGR